MTFAPLDVFAGISSRAGVARLSRTYYHAYHLAGEQALSIVLHRQYDGLVDIQEVIDAVRSKNLHASRPADREKIIAFLDARCRTDEIRRLAPRTGTTQPLPDLREEDYMTRRNIVFANALRRITCFPLFPSEDTSIYLSLLYPADRFIVRPDLNGIRLRTLLASLPDIEGPNLAFQKIWLEFQWQNDLIFEGLFKPSVIHDGKWPWGYALWDARRLYEWRWQAPVYRWC
ncbi:hypothetical protein BJX61DRAFT_539633 [Aspergillus egyptiacus]|nr:hypothetical protein BJX61DRAFT_539633 [Aspergillus egyptiacus]